MIGYLIHLVGFIVFREEVDDLGAPMFPLPVLEQMIVGVRRAVGQRGLQSVSRLI